MNPRVPDIVRLSFLSSSFLFFSPALPLTRWFGLCFYLFLFLSLLSALFSVIDGGWIELEHGEITNKITNSTDKQQQQRLIRRGLVDEAYSEMSCLVSSFVMCLIVIQFSSSISFVRETF